MGKPQGNEVLRDYCQFGQSAHYLGFTGKELSTFGQFRGMNRNISDLGVITGFR